MMTLEIQKLDPIFSLPYYQFKDSHLLLSALTHRSFKDHTPHNERLEFLGDAVLGLILAQYLMERFPDAPEGQLTQYRASLVNESMLAEIAKELGLSSALRMGKGEKESGGQDKPRLLASGLEALIGAIYLDSGFHAANEWVKKLYDKKIEQLSSDHFFERDFKTRLQEHYQALEGLTPTYVLKSSSGPEHDKTFLVEVVWKDQPLATGQGRSKKQAEQEAAKNALNSISKEIDHE